MGAGLLPARAGLRAVFAGRGTCHLIHAVIRSRWSRGAPDHAQSSR
jgi:hypothetical protein